MYPTIIYLFGLIPIQSYGLMIALGLMLYIWLLKRDPRTHTLMTMDQLFNGIIIAIIAALAGARILYILLNNNEFQTFTELINIWQGGLCILGSVIALLIVLPCYMRYNAIKILPTLDLAAYYAPIFQAIARLGCFLGGCCYGIKTSSFFGIYYTPALATIHPTQLYSSIAHLLLFLMLYCARKTSLKEGSLVGLYLIGESIERFLTDFLRAERTFFAPHDLLSINQWLCLGIIGITALGLCYHHYGTYLTTHTQSSKYR